MNWKILNHPLGSPGSIGAPVKTEWIVSAALGAASLASSIFGGASSARAAKEAERERKQEKSQLEAERLRKKNQNWTDTMSGQNTMRVLRDQARDEIRRMQGAAAVGGGTDAAVAMEKEQQNRKQAEVIAQANSNYEDKKEDIDATYRREIAGVNRELVASEQAKANATAQVAGAVSNALAQGAMIASSAGGGNNKVEDAGGSPGGGGVQDTNNSGGLFKSVDNVLKDKTDNILKNTSKTVSNYLRNYNIINPHIHAALTGFGYA